MAGEPIIVVVDGGCVQDVLGVECYDVFDWDNFNDNPIAYWEENGESEMMQVIRDTTPSLYEEIVERVEKVKARQENEKRKDPFWMVEAV